MRTRQRLEQIHLHADFPAAAFIIARLAPAYTVLAGGGVRDALLGVVPKDLDLATAAHPDVVAGAFPRTVDVGREFGTIVVVTDGRPLEVTTFRREGAYHDGRRPTAVEFTDAAEDSGRRDFTVNALYYEPAAETIVDYVGGLRDLSARVLRTVGDPRARFAEDHLRMLRAVRFVAQLGFTLDPAAVEAIREGARSIASVAGERTLAEMKRLLTSPYWRQGLAAARACGLLEYVFPECSLDDVEAELRFVSFENAFAFLTLAAPAAAVDRRLDAWRASRESRRRVRDQVRDLRTLEDRGTSGAARARALGGSFGTDVAALARARGLDVAADVARLRRAGGDVGALPRPILTGRDLISAGIRPGADLGTLLGTLYDEQLEGRVTDEAGARAWLAGAKP